MWIRYGAERRFLGFSAGEISEEEKMKEKRRNKN
jgi:hypothetical protein